MKHLLGDLRCLSLANKPLWEGIIRDLGGTRANRYNDPDLFEMEAKGLVEHLKGKGFILTELGKRFLASEGELA